MARRPPLPDYCPNKPKIESLAPARTGQGGKAVTNLRYGSQS